MYQATSYFTTSRSFFGSIPVDDGLVYFIRVNHILKIIAWKSFSRFWSFSVAGSGLFVCLCDWLVGWCLFVWLVGWCFVCVIGRLVFCLCDWLLGVFLPFEWITLHYFLCDSCFKNWTFVSIDVITLIMRLPRTKQQPAPEQNWGFPQLLPSLCFLTFF